MNLGDSPIVSVVNGTDFFLQTLRVKMTGNIVQASNKVHDSAARGCTFDGQARKGVLLVLCVTQRHPSWQPLLIASDGMYFQVGQAWSVCLLPLLHPHS